MRRRTVLAGVAVGLPSVLAGCTGSSGGGSDATEPPTTSDAPATTAEPTGNADLVSATLVPREECPSPGEATVEFGGEGSATVTGCVVGRNACYVPRLRRATFDSARGVARVVVAAVDGSDDDEACAEVIVDRGYEVRIDAGDASLTAVEVVHDDTDGRRVVADVTR